MMEVACRGAWRIYWLSTDESKSFFTTFIKLRSGAQSWKISRDERTLVSRFMCRTENYLIYWTDRLKDVNNV